MADVSTIRALDAVKALAFIGDLSMGQPTNHSLRTSWLAARLAAAAGHDDAQCGVVKEVSLLRWSGCTANASGFSAMLGDDIGGREAMLAMRPGWAGAAEAQGRLEATITPLAQIHCEVSGEIARMLGGVEITIAEELGVEKRGEFYDNTGALRDMVQNHALQLLCAIAMEPPINAHADAIRDEKLKVLRSLRRWTPETLNQHVVRGQYAAGMSFGKAVNGYLQEPGVPPLSHTETYVALRTEIDNWRWAGVPFYIRTGKRLAGREARIVVNFRPTPHAIFKAPQRANNQLVINLQPNDGLELHLLAEGQAQRQARTPGSSQTLAPVQLDLDFDSRFGSGRVGAYERLLLDVIDGRLNLFVRSDEQEAAWRWVQPILENWQTDSNPIRSYPAGTWGPPAASAMIARDGHCWNEER